LFDWNALEDTVALRRREAVAGGEKARMLLELGDSDETKHRTIRRRLAATLVHLGVRLDPMAAEGLEQAG
jgi:hypothetical protein